MSKSQVCQFIVNTDTLSQITTDETFKISKGPLNCNWKLFIFQNAKKCKTPHIGKAQTKFRTRLKNYKSAHKSLKTKKRETQKLFYGSLLNCAPTRFTHYWYTPARLTRMRAFTLTNKRLTHLFLSCVVSVVKYGLRLKNPRKATGPDFIPLKVIKFASNVIDPHLYSIIIKDLEKISTQKSQKQH